MRAISYAKATRPDTLKALTIQIDEAETAALLDEWARRDMDVPLMILESPYREVTRPLLEYVRHLRENRPHDVVTIFLPEYVLGRWWEQLLHNQSALRLKARLLFEPGVMVTSVPWQLKSSHGQPELVTGLTPGPPANPSNGRHESRSPGRVAVHRRTAGSDR